jgi:hypothetical protein
MRSTCRTARSSSSVGCFSIPARRNGRISSSSLRRTTLLSSSRTAPSPAESWEPDAALRFLFPVHCFVLPTLLNFALFSAIAQIAQKGACFRKLPRSFVRAEPYELAARLRPEPHITPRRKVKTPLRPRIGTLPSRTSSACSPSFAISRLSSMHYTRRKTEFPPKEPPH